MSTKAKPHTHEVQIEIDGEWTTVAGCNRHSHIFSAVGRAEKKHPGCVNRVVSCGLVEHAVYSDNLHGRF